MQNILVVDDSALMRKLMCDIINSVDGYQVSDVCADGQSAYNRMKSGNYAAVTLSLSMPTLSGTDILSKLRDDGIKVPVIAISSSIKEDREKARKAIDLGAADFVLRPLKVNSPQMKEFSEKLVDSLKFVISGGYRSKSVVDAQISQSMDDTPAPVRRADTPALYDIVAIASSTGGPAALQTLIPMLTARINVPIVIVQHMPTGFTASLAERIDNHSKLKVKEAKNGEVLKPGMVYIAPGGHQLKIGENDSGDHITKVTTDPPVNNLRPCADVMFESLLTSSYKKILCVVLTGMGSDGVKGISSLKKRKNIYVITQDKKSCVVYGMPKAAYEYGLSDRVCDIKEMATVIAKKLGV